MRVLIAVAEQKLAGVIGRGLKEEGYSTEVVRDGESALERLADEPAFDLLILDSALPMPDGLDVLHVLREDQIEAPVLALTPGDAGDDVARTLNLGADAALTKPFVFDELLARAREGCYRCVIESWAAGSCSRRRPRSRISRAR